MISSKAIFIGRKRAKLLPFLLVFISMGLSAASYRIGLSAFENTSISYLSSFSQMLSFSAGSVLNEDLLQKARESDSEREERAYEIAVSEAIRNERDASSIEKAESDKSSYSAEIVSLSLSDEERGYLMSGDEAALWYIKHANDLDELYLIDVSEDDGLFDVDIYLDGKLLFHFIHSPYVESSAEEEILRYFALRYRASGYSLVRVSGNVDAEIVLDGSAVERYGNYILAEKGLHHVSINSASYVSAEADVTLTASFESYEYSLSEVRTVPLFISTIPYTDEIYYQGRRVDEGYVEETTYPFSLIVNRPGYETRSIQSDVGRESVMTVLLPSDLYSSERLNEKKNVFYTHLLLTLLSFGGSVAVNSISDIYSLDYLSPLTVAFQGVGVIELVRTVTALFEYRDALNYGI